jgi:hypothetical protein
MLGIPFVFALEDLAALRDFARYLKLAAAPQSLR